jgi:hypothetical protein
MYHAQLIATNSDGTASSADLAFTTPTLTPAGSVLPPVLSAVHQSAVRWAEANRQAGISGARRLPVGTTISFTLNEPATVTMTFTRTVAGQMIHHRCVAPSRRAPHRARCTRTVVGGTLTFAGHGGANAVRFYGRLSRRTRLAPGRWTLAITAALPSGLRSRPQTLAFTIVAHRR